MVRTTTSEHRVSLLSDPHKICKVPLDPLREMENWQPERRLRLSYPPGPLRSASEVQEMMPKNRKEGRKERDSWLRWNRRGREPARGELSRREGVVCRGKLPSWPLGKRHILPSGLQKDQQKGIRSKSWRSLCSENLAP